MKYYFLTTGSEQGTELPTKMITDYEEIRIEYKKYDDDDYFYIGIYEFDTETLEVNELQSKGYMTYE